MAVGVSVIALESTSYLGADHTTGPFRWIWEHIFGPVPDARWDVFHIYIRKTGHFVGYGTMGLLWLRAWWMTLPRANFLLDAVLALFGTAVVAIADESHQSFIANRKGIPSDVLLDCCGAFVLLFLVYVAFRIAATKRHARVA